MAMEMIDNKELTVTEARDNFSQLVNRAAFGGEVTFVHRGRNHEAVAAIVPAGLVEQYEAFLDQEDGRIAMERLADLKAGRDELVPAEEIERKYGL
jgi:prevent-host-death family protein